MFTTLIAIFVCATMFAGCGSSEPVSLKKAYSVPIENRGKAIEKVLIEKLGTPGTIAVDYKNAIALLSNQNKAGDLSSDETAPLDLLVKGFDSAFAAALTWQPPENLQDFETIVRGNVNPPTTLLKYLVLCRMVNIASQITPPSSKCQNQLIRDANQFSSTKIDTYDPQQSFWFQKFLTACHEMKLSEDCFALALEYNIAKLILNFYLFNSGVLRQYPDVLNFFNVCNQYAIEFQNCSTDEQRKVYVDVHTAAIEIVVEMLHPPKDPTVCFEQHVSATVNEFRDKIIPLLKSLNCPYY